MKCIVRKLKATIDNANLPVFENVVLKNYLTTTQDGQYIEFSDIAHRLNNTKMEARFEVTTTDKKFAVFGSSDNQYIQRNNGYIRAVNEQEGALSAIAANTEIHAGFDTSDGSFFINETTGVCAGPSQSTMVGHQCMVFQTFNRGSWNLAGTTKIKMVKITNHLNEVYTLVPAEVNGVAGLYDTDRGTFYTEANGGTLLCG